MTNINPELIIQFLNELNKIDSFALSKLMNFRVSTNKAMADHETVQVLEDKKDNEIDYKFGLLGILNGLCGIDEQGWGYIVAETNVNDEIIKFIHRKDMDK